MFLLVPKDDIWERSVKTVAISSDGPRNTWTVIPCNDFVSADLIAQDIGMWTRCLEKGRGLSCQSALTGAKLRWSGVLWEHRITSGWATWALWFSRGFFSGWEPLVLPSRSSLSRFRFLAIVGSDRLYFFSWLAGMALLIGWSDPACQSALTGAKLRWRSFAYFPGINVWMWKPVSPVKRSTFAPCFSKYRPNL